MVPKMNDALRASYDALPYRHGSIPLSHPSRIGAIARLLGIDAAAPEGARVLELGCAEGMNLLPLAERLPNAQFVGVDFSPVQIAVAEQARAAAKLENVRFVCADLREFSVEPEAYNYVIAHGVYSWVPADVRERVLALCRTALAPSGVAYVSYNTQPGWGLVSGLRSILLSELEPFSEPKERVRQLEKILGALAQSIAAQGGPYAELMRELIADLRAKPAELVLHDELELVSGPASFREFTTHARQHGLHFLSEAHFASMPFDHLPGQVRAPLAGLGLDVFGEQQFLDLLGNRRFRSTLLSRHEIAHPRALEVSAIRDCALTTRLRLAQTEVDLRSGVRMEVSGAHGVKFALDQPAQKAFLAALISRAPERVPFPEVLAHAGRILEQSGLPAQIDAAFLLHAVGRLFGVDQIDLLLAGAGDWLQPGAVLPSALVAYQAGANLPVVNRWHETVVLSPEDRHTLASGRVPTERERWMEAGLLG